VIKISPLITQASTTFPKTPFLSKQNFLRHPKKVFLIFQMKFY